MTYKELFGDCKPVMAMLHLKGRDREETLERARKEARIYYENGVDAVLVENYFGTEEEAEEVLAWLKENYPDRIYGVNILDDWARSFELATRHGARFVQIDSVCGHLAPRPDELFAARLAAERLKHDVVLLGGVRFKYKPVASGRSLKEDLELARGRCDAIVVTGEGTGRQTPLAKIQEFRCHLGDFSIVVGAGVTAGNIGETFEMADGAIVGSYFKDDHKVGGDVNPDNVKEFTQLIVSSEV